MRTTPRKTILVIGATGFLGPALVEEFINGGYRVVCGIRNLKKAASQLPTDHVEFLQVDLNRDLDPHCWLQRLRRYAINGVVNNVGVANAFGGQSLTNVNVRAPVALFQAVQEFCAENRRIGSTPERLPVIQISTTGVNWPDCDRFDYPRTKKMTDKALMAMDDLDWIIVRPNIIYEPERGHLVLEQIARMPVIFYIGHAPIQPIHCRELAIGIVRLMRSVPAASKLILDATGPEVMTWKQVFAHTKRALGMRQGIFVPVPLQLAQLVTMLIQQLPEDILYRLGILSKMDPETIVMMTRGSTASNKQWLQYTGMTPVRLYDAYAAYGRGPECHARLIALLDKGAARQPGSA